MVGQTKFLEIADEAVAHLERLMEHYPHLVSPHVRFAVQNWQGRIHCNDSVELPVMDIKMMEDDALAKAAIELLEYHQMEDVMAMLTKEFSTDVDYHRLIALVGKDHYLSALQREANELRMNSISFEQAVDLWNSLGKPPLGGDKWTSQSISMLTE